jgi:FkbM family methyltransferase
MLIPLHELMKHFVIQINGILHIGAHECEELSDYNNIGVTPTNIYWVEGQKEKVDLMSSKGVPNIFHAIIDDVDDKEIVLNISNNGQSSSILDFGTHTIHHPHVHYVSQIKDVTTRLDTLIEKNNIPIETLNFVNLDIQGVELRALKSMEKYLQHFQYIYTEVNVDYVYKDCNLVSEIDEYLARFGFKRVATRMAGRAGWGDAFYIKT